MVQKRKIAVICYQDGAKSGLELSHAMARHSNYDVDYAYYQCDRQAYARAIKNADVIITACDSLSYIKDGKFYLYNNGGTKLFSPGSSHVVKPGVIMISRPVGAKYRRKSSGYHKAYEIWPLRKYRDNYDAVYPVEPNMNYPEINDGWLPHAINTDTYEYAWRPPEGRVVVSAYTANEDSKLVYKHLVPAINAIRKDGIDIELILSGAANHVSHEEFKRRMLRSTVYYGQITCIGVYGRSEVEAMAMGVPVICGISEESKKRAGNITNYGEACIKASDTKELEVALRGIVTGKMPLGDISMKSRQYAINVHGYESVAHRLSEYIDLIKKRKNI